MTSTAKKKAGFSAAGFAAFVGILAGAWQLDAHWMTREAHAADMVQLEERVDLRFLNSQKDDLLRRYLMLIQAEVEYPDNPKIPAALLQVDEERKEVDEKIESILRRRIGAGGDN